MAYTKFEDFTLRNSVDTGNEYVVGYHSSGNNKYELRYPISLFKTGDDFTINITGDATGSGSSIINLTLASVNNNTGTFGSNTSIPIPTVNAKGLITAISQVPIQVSANSLIGTTLASNITSSSITSVGSGYILHTIADVSNWNNAYTFTSSFNTNYNELVGINSVSGTNGFLKKISNSVWTLDTNSYLTENQTISLSGIVTGSGKTSITTSIADAALSIAKTANLQSTLDTKMSISNYPNIVYIEGLSGTSGILRKTTTNTWSLDTTKYVAELTSINTLASTITAYTLISTDSNKIIESTSSSPVTISIPDKSVYNFAIGTKIDIMRYGTGTVTFSVGTDNIIRSRNNLLTIGHQYAGVSLIKRSNGTVDEWYLIGDLA